MEWQLIDTAPRDGTWVLLKGGKTDEDFYLTTEGADAMATRPVVGKYDANDEAMGFYPKFNDTWLFSFWDGSWYSRYGNPTHWVAIPD